MQRIGIAIVAWAAWAGAAWAWTPVGPGIDYAEFHTPDPNNVFVARMDRDNTDCFVDSMLAGSRLKSVETIGSQASRYEDAINYWDRDWGQRNDVIVAINGDFPEADNTPLNGQVMSGWYLDRLSGRMFSYLPDQNMAIGYASTAYQQVVFLDAGQTLAVDALNRVRDSEDLLIYTPHYNSTTGTDNTGVEVLVEMTRPTLIAPTSGAPVGTIRQIRQNAGSTPIPFDHVVISATGSRAASVLQYASIGQRVKIVFSLASSPLGLNHTYAAIGSGENFLGNGQVYGGQDVRHPRTAIAYNDKYLFFVVVDGRRTSSVGMTMTELGYFCKDYLGATWGVNQDGGGSSTMIVNGVLKNSPSDGSQRAVINGMFMGVLRPKQHATTFYAADVVKTTASSSTVRLGPGTNYLSLTTVGRNTEGTVLDHHLRGVYAKGYYWYRIDFNGTVGWVAHNLLTLVSSGNLPRFTQNPVAQYVCPGGNASFAVAASGTGTQSYRWQFDGSDLSDDATYAGSSTPTLTVTSAQAAQAGSYRCQVTDAIGTTTSWSAPLRVMVPTTILAQPEPRMDPLVIRGTDVVFSVRARGEGALTYRWQKNGVDISDSADFAGTATDTLTVWAADTSDEGEYRCRVSGVCGVIYTEPAPLVVLSADFDRDGDVDQSDFGHLQACFSGPTVPQTDPACKDANLDADGTEDVDLADLTVLLSCFSGANVPRAPGC